MVNQGGVGKGLDLKQGEDMPRTKKKKKSAVAPAPVLQHAELKLVKVRPQDVGKKFIFLGDREDDKVLNRSVIPPRVREYAENIEVVVRDGTTIELIDNGDDTFSIVDGQNRLSALSRAGVTASFLAFMYPRRFINRPGHPFTWAFVRSRMVSGRNAARTTLPQMLRMTAKDSPWYEYCPTLAPEIQFTLDTGSRSNKRVRLPYKLLVQGYVNALAFEEYYDDTGEIPRYATASSGLLMDAWENAEPDEIGKTVQALRWWVEHSLSHRSRRVQKLLVTARGMTLMLMFFKKYGDTAVSRKAAAKFATYESDLLGDLLRLHRNNTPEYVSNWMNITNYNRRSNSKGGLFELMGVTGREGL
jgi:hypothetical protein